MDKVIAVGKKYFVAVEHYGTRISRYVVFSRTGRGFSQEVYRSWYKKCAMRKYEKLEKQLLDNVSAFE